MTDSEKYEKETKEFIFQLRHFFAIYDIDYEIHDKLFILKFDDDEYESIIFTYDLEWDKFDMTYNSYQVKIVYNPSRPSNGLYDYVFKNYSDLFSYIKSITSIKHKLRKKKLISLTQY